MPIGTGKAGLFGGKPTVLAGSETFNTPGVFTVPEGLEKVTLTGNGSTSNAGNPGNPGTPSPGGNGGPGGYITCPGAACWSGGVGCCVGSGIGGLAGLGCPATGGPGNPGNPGGATTVLGYNWTGGAVGNGGTGGVNGRLGNPGGTGRSYTNGRIYDPCNVPVGYCRYYYTANASGGNGTIGVNCPTSFNSRGGVGRGGAAGAGVSNKFPGAYNNYAVGGGGGAGARCNCAGTYPQAIDGGSPPFIDGNDIYDRGVGGNGYGWGGMGGQSSAGCGNTNQNPGMPGVGTTPGFPTAPNSWNIRPNARGGGGGGGGGAATRLSGVFCGPGGYGARASGGGGGGGRGGNGNPGSGAGNPGSVGVPATYNCVVVTEGCYPVEVGTGAQIVISWNTQ